MMSFLRRKQLDIKTIQKSRTKDFAWVQLKESYFHETYDILSRLNKALVDLRNQYKRDGFVDGNLEI